MFEGVNGMYGIHVPGHYNAGIPILPVTKEDDFLTRYQDAVLSKLTIGGSLSEAERNLLSANFHLNTFTNYFEGILL